MGELIYILWIAVGTAGFWESVEGVRRLRELRWFPDWAWPFIAGMAPVVWIALVQAFFHPFDPLVYAIITIIFMGILNVQKISIWYSLPILLLQTVMFFFFQPWHVQADYFFVVLIVEVLGLILSLLRLSSVWAVIMIVLWIIVKPFFYPSADQFNDLIDLIGLFLPLFLYLKENTRRLRILFERDHDPLTGLLNRTSFNDWLLEVKDIEGALIIVDLDDFKFINDHFGHQVGDQILIEMGNQIIHAIPKEAKAFRWGGDEFVIVCPDTKDIETAQMIAEDVHNHISNGTNAISCKASIGIALGILDDELFNKADIALLNVKQSGKHRLEWYQEDLGAGKDPKNFKNGQTRFRSHNQELFLNDLILTHLFAGVLLLNEEHVIIRINKTFTDLTGFTTIDVLDKSPDMLRSKENSLIFNNNIWHQAEAGEVVQEKITCCKKDGGFNHLLLHLRMVKDDEMNSVYFLASLTDINGNDKTEMKV